MQALNHPFTRRGLGAVAATAAVAALGRPGLAQGKRFKVALSNSYIGNKWRLEMENVFKAALGMEPFKSEIEGSVYNADNDVSKLELEDSEPPARAGPPGQAVRVELPKAFPARPRGCLRPVKRLL